jgi:hypothetical protein
MFSSARDQHFTWSTCCSLSCNLQLELDTGSAAPGTLCRIPLAHLCPPALLVYTCLDVCPSMDSHASIVRCAQHTLHQVVPYCAAKHDANFEVEVRQGAEPARHYIRACAHDDETGMAGLMHLSMAAGMGAVSQTRS